MKPLFDQHSRLRFTQEVDQPFCVVAPAGVGKTHAIVERVANMLVRDETPVALVTYTNKAAQEMRERLEKKLRKAGVNLSSGQLFVGTIHSLCADRIQKNAFEWGLKLPVEICTQAQKAWNDFLQEEPNPLEGLEENIQARYWKHFGIFPLGLILETDLSGEEFSTDAPSFKFTAPPTFSFQKLFVADIRGPAKKTLDRLKNWAEEFLNKTSEMQAAEVFIPELPEKPNESSAVLPLYEEVFGPYLRWKSNEGLVYLKYLASRFAAWRLKKALYFYEDLIRVAAMYEKPCYSIVLDEAQDASLSQLKLLKKMALSAGEKLQLTMVGDPQQLIYSRRASLQVYQRFQDELIESCGAEKLTFSVTFRCPVKVVNWVNISGPHLFGETSVATKTQVDFVPLAAKPDAKEGNVARLKLHAKNIGEDESLEERDRKACEALCEALLPHLNLANAHQVAFLAPQKEWLFKLKNSFERRGVRVQLYADSSTPSLAQRFLRAILHLMLYPFDRFELVGFLRELFPVSDRELSLVARTRPSVLTILIPPPKDIPQNLFNALKLLHEAWILSRKKSMPEAIMFFVDHIQMTERIAALAEVYGEKLVAQWESELLNAISISVGERTLAAVIAKLDQSAADVVVEHGALQLMTLHKAKGLEWPIVVLPFLYRLNKDSSPVYPVLEKNEMNGTQTGLSWKHDRDFERLRKNENFERLLYVGLTRAKEELILVDDSSLYEEVQGSAAERMKITFGAPLYQAFSQLPEPILKAEVVESEIIEVDVSNLKTSPRKSKPVINPSSLVLDLPLVEQGIDGGVVYGDWWHALWYDDLFIRKQKPEDVEELKKQLLKKASLSVYAKRATDELNKLFESWVWATLFSAEVKKIEIRTEVPFLAELEDKILEGRIDLLCLGQQNIIIDWKTDQQPPEVLAQAYAPQMMAYKESFQLLLKQPVQVWLYNTVYGNVVEF
jgi:ATP-dependent exoDNAse (exonuclease V) beta subunit